MITKIVAVLLAGAFLGWSQTNNGRAKNTGLDGTWELVSGQPLPESARDIKIISRGHFIFTAYDVRSGKPLYTGGGTYTFNGDSYTEHIDFASAEISAGLVGKDQPFTVKLNGDVFTQTGTRSNGKPLAEIWKRID
jgi:hypothetical protein